MVEGLKGMARKTKNVKYHLNMDMMNKVPMITALILVLFSMTSATTSATNLCDEVVATLWDFREYTELNDAQIKAIAGRCYTEYVDSVEESENK
jgi:hypothetical protein